MAGSMASVGAARKLWLRWVIANSLGEAVGLGAASLLGAALALGIQAAFGTLAPLVIFVVAVLAGTFEGLVVGAAQSLVLKQALPALRPRHWIAASAAGAFVAWVLGMLPSTLIDFGAAAAGSAPPPDIPDALQYLFAAGLGLLAGPILGFAQWIVLRDHVRGAGWWLPANALGWALGMPLVFMVAGSAPPSGITAGFVLLVLGVIALVGAVVGMVHGAFLIWLLRRGQPRLAST